MEETIKNKELKEDKRIYTMAEEKPVKAVLKMGVPVAMGMLFMVAYNLVDTYFIGKLHDDYQLAATNLAYPIMMVMVALAGIVGNGGSSYIARCIGAGDMDEANHTLTIGFEMILISSIILSILGVVFINPIVTVLGAKEHAFTYTREYVLVIILGSFFTMGNYAFGQLLRSEGSTMYSMIGMIAGTVANIILDPIFIFTLRLEIKGAAIATILGNVIGVAIFLSYYVRKKTLLRPSIKWIKPHKRIIGEIMWVGIPHTLEQFLATAAIIVNNNLAASYGELTVAAMGVSSKIMSFGTYIYQGLTAGCQPLMGYNYGAKNFDRIRKVIRAGILVTTTIELVIMAFFGIFAPALIAIFTGTKEVIVIGIKALRAAMLMLPFVATTSIVRNCFNSMGKPFFAFGITIVRQLLLYIPMLLLFNALWGFDGLIHAQPAEEFICAIFASVLLFAMLKHYETLDQNNG